MTGMSVLNRIFYENVMLFLPEQHAKKRKKLGRGKGPPAGYLSR